MSARHRLERGVQLQIGGSNLKPYKAELHEECIRLRVEQRLSLRAIHKKTGASMGSLSRWLKDYPLPDVEKKKRMRESGLSRRKARAEESKFHRLVGKIPKERKGKIAEAAVLFRLTLLGFEVYGSPFDGDKVDWAARLPGGQLLMVQVRSAQEGQHRLPIVSLQCSNGRKGLRRYQEDEFDVLVGYDLFSDTAYVWLKEELERVKTMVTVSEPVAEAWDKVMARSSAEERRLDAPDAVGSTPTEPKVMGR